MDSCKNHWEKLKKVMRTVSGQIFQSAVENSYGAAWTVVWNSGNTNCGFRTWKPKPPLPAQTLASVLVQALAKMWRCGCTCMRVVHKQPIARVYQRGSPVKTLPLNCSKLSSSIDSRIFAKNWKYCCKLCLKIKRKDSDFLQDKWKSKNHIWSLGMARFFTPKSVNV